MNAPLAVGFAVLIAVAACAADHQAGKVDAPPSANRDPGEGGQSDADAVPVVPYDRPFQLAFARQVRIERGETRARFAELLEDSRCPPDVECFQAGRVRVRLEVTRGSAAPVSIELGSDPDEELRSAGGVTWELQGIAPASAAGRRPEDYLLTLVAHPLRGR